MKKLVSIIIWAIFSLNTYCQNIQSAFGFGGDSPGSFVVSDSSNIYCTGSYFNVRDFDPDTGTYNLTSVPLNFPSGFYSSDAFISKFDSSGKLLWARSVGGNDEDWGGSIAIDGNGNVYVCGFFKDTADFDPGAGTYNLISTGKSDIFILKLSPAGNFVWAKTIGGSGIDIAYSITASPSGNIYLTGKFENTVDFNPGAVTYNLSSAGSWDAFILKLDASGNFGWAKRIGGYVWDIGRSICYHATGYLYITGYFEDQVDLDPGSGWVPVSSRGLYDIFILKLDVSGNYIWGRPIGGGSFDEGNSVVSDNSGNVYITGNFVDSVDFDPGSGISKLYTKTHSDDIFVLKLDGSGNFVWAKSMGGTLDDMGFSIDVDDSGNVYTTGYFKDTVDFNPGSGTNILISKGGNDLFFSKLNNAGNYISALRFGSQNDYEFGFSIRHSKNGRIYLYSDVGFDSSSYYLHPDYHRSYVTKMWPCQTISNTATIVGSSSVCPGATTNYSINSVSGATGYTWTVPADATINSGQNSTSINVTFGAAPGKITMTPKNNCGNGFTRYLLISVSPFITITPSSSTICERDSVTLKASGAITYSWSPATGLNATNGNTVIAKPSSTTTYTVTGTSGSCVGTKTITVIVNPLPTISITPAIPSFCEGTGISITTNGANTYKWSPSTGLSDTTGATVFANPAVTTTYIITGTSSFGCKSNKTFTVIVKANPTLTISPSVPVICKGNPVTLKVAGANSYNWTPSTGLNTTSGDSVVANPPSTTTYTIYGTNADGCVSTKTVTVVVNPLPNVYAIPSSSLCCEGSSVSITAYGAKTYLWSPSTGLSSTTASTVTASPLITTTYTIIGTDSLGCTSTATVTITVNPIPTFTISPSTSTICRGDSINLVASGNYNYTWSPSSGLNTTIGAVVVASPIITTIYTVTGTNSNTGCSNSKSVKIIVNPIPQLTIFPTTPSYCLGGSVSISVSGAKFYSWSPAIGLSSTTGATVIANPSITTTYLITGTDSLGCIGTKTITVIVNPLPIITTVPSSPSICITGSVGITASGANTYSWSPSTGLSGTTGSTVIANPSVTTTYTITGTSSFGCTNTKTVVVSIDSLPTVLRQPVSKSVVVGSNTMFIVSSASPNSAFQWQQNSGTAFVDLSNTGHFSGVTNDTLTIKSVTFSLHNNSYQCIVNNGSCYTESNIAILGVNNVGIENAIKENRIELFPNPANHILTIKLNNSSDLTYRIIDLLGRQFALGNLNKSTTFLDINDLAPGLYFIELSDSNNKIVNVKFVKK